MMDHGPFKPLISTYCCKEKHENDEINCCAL